MARTRISREDFERAVREHHAATYRAAVRITRDEASALDAAQQVYLRLLDGRIDARGGDLGRLLRCAAAREALMRLRSERARARREATEGMEPREHDPRELAGVEEEKSALRRCVAELPDELRHAVVLRYAEGLTLAEVGRALSISEPSALGRVRRAVERLRERMSRLGFAAFATAIDERLPEAVPGAEQALAVPAKLESSLLALKAASAPLSLGAIAAAAAAVVGTVAVAVATLGNESDPRGSGDTVAAAAQPRPEPVSDTSEGVETALGMERAEIAGRVPETSAEPRSSQDLAPGILEGRVSDEFGLAVAGATVMASSVERDGKFASLSGETTTGRDGTFRLELPVRVESGQDYRLTARTPTLVQDGGVARVRSSRTSPFVRITMSVEVPERPGAWQLWLTLRDEAGAPVEGAVARVHSIVRHSQGARWPQQLTGAMSDGAGAVTLHGEGLGMRLLSVDARKHGLAPIAERIQIDEAGETRRELVLREGLAITGTIVDDAGAPVTVERLGRYSSALHVIEPALGTWFTAELVEPGRFRIPALASEPHELRFRHERWSSFKIDRVTPGGPELSLQLKRKGDTRDVGNHGAEIHGSLADAATGEPVNADALTAWLEEIGDDSPALRDGDFAPLILEAVMAQTAQLELGDERSLPPPLPPHAFVYDDLAPGRYAVRIHARGFAPTLVGPIELDEREIASGFDVRLARGATVEGVVLDAAGRPLAGAFVIPLGGGGLSRAHVEELDRELRSTAGRGSTHTSARRTDADGRFELAHVPTDVALHLVALHPEHEPLHGPVLDLREATASGGHELRFVTRRER